MAKAAPLPIFSAFAQPGLHRIAMNVAKLLHELLLISDIEVVIPLFPKMLRIADQSPRNTLL
jgi:hypothetical protein